MSRKMQEPAASPSAAISITRLVPYWVVSAIGGLIFGLGTCGLWGIVSPSLGIVMGLLVSLIVVGLGVEWLFQRAMNFQSTGRVKLATTLGFGLIASGPATGLMLLLMSGFCGAASPGCMELPYVSLACGLAGPVAGITLTLAAL